MRLGEIFMNCKTGFVATYEEFDCIDVSTGREFNLADEGYVVRVGEVREFALLSESSAGDLLFDPVIRSVVGVHVSPEAEALYVVPFCREEEWYEIEDRLPPEVIYDTDKVVRVEVKL